MSSLPDLSPHEALKLFAAWKAGDAAAGRSFYERSAGPIKRYFRLRLNGLQDISDLTQETFLRAQRTEFRGEGSVRGFLFGIACRVFLEHLRRRYHERLHQGSEEQLSPAAADLEDDPEYMLRQSEERRLLMKALRRIPLRYQLVIEMSMWGELTQAQIARELGCPAPTVGRWKSEAFDALETRMNLLDGSEDARKATTETLKIWRRRMQAEVGPFAEGRGRAGGAGTT